MMPADDHLAELSDSAEDRLERVFEAFEAAWRDGRPPRIEDYLPPGSRLRRAALFEMLYIDQEYAIRAGSPGGVEGYLARFPEFAADADLPIELIAREFRHRLRRGDDPTIGEYLGRFPDLADRLEGRLRAERGGESRPSDATTVDGPRGEPAGGPYPPDLDGPGPPYDRVRHHAQGGMGDVYRARDVELDREVALKKVRPEYAGEARVRRRFLREARLTARLDHPGVVPIHGLIHDRAGRPWYVMRFVDGGTLARAIDEHRADAAGVGPEGRALAFRKLLARFVAVCDTIAYAHSRGVIHRDLKPSNVILGQYGETVVVDWGLATSPGAAPGSEDDPPALLALAPGEHGDPPTFPGQALGTPAYMSPEQAEGSPTMNRPASDIYGLGAILYGILTGRPPFDPAGWPGNLEDIIAGRFPHPRQVAPGVPRALEAVCLKAMARDPGGRFATAGELARDVERWAADEPVSAWREPFGPRARRWTRRHRTAVTAASAAVVASLVGLAVVLAVQTRSNRDLSAKNEELDRAKVHAEDRFDLALEAVRSFRAGVTEDEMLGQREFRGLRDKLLRSAAGFHERLEGLLQGEADRKSLRTLGQSYFELGGLISEIGAKPEALAAHRKGLAVRRSLAGPGDLPAHGDLGLSLIAVGKLASQTGDHAGALSAYEEARSLATDLVAAEPDAPAYRTILASAHHDIGALLAETGDPAGALRSHRQALAIREGLASARPQDRDYLMALAGSLNNIARLLPGEGDHAGAVAMQRRALDFFARIAAAQPADTQARRNLAIGHQTLGNLLSASGDQPGALVADRHALAIREGLAASDPADTGFQSDLADSHHNVNIRLRIAGDAAGSLRASREALAIRGPLAERNPTVARYGRALASSLEAIGVVSLDRGDLESAIPSFRRAVAIREGLAGSPPSLPSDRHNLAITRHNLGVALGKKGDLGESLRVHREALPVFESLAAAEPAGVDYRTGLAGSHDSIGRVLAGLGDLPGSFRAFREALRIRQALADARPGVAAHQDDLTRSLDQVARVGLMAREAAASVDALRRSIARLAPAAKAPEDLYDLACLRSLLAEAAAMPNSGLSPDRARAESDAAADALRAAIGAGYARLSHMRADSDLASIRDRPDVRALFADLAMPASPFAR